MWLQLQFIAQQQFNIGDLKDARSRNSLKLAKVKIITEKFIFLIKVFLKLKLVVQFSDEERRDNKLSIGDSYTKNYRKVI